MSNPENEAMIRLCEVLPPGWRFQRVFTHAKWPTGWGWIAQAVINGPGGTMLDWRSSPICDSVADALNALADIAQQQDLKGHGE